MPDTSAGPVAAAAAATATTATTTAAAAAAAVAPIPAPTPAPAPALIPAPASASAPVPTPGVSSLPLPASSNPPPQQLQPSSTTPDTRRASTADKGIPYYEKIRKDLREMLQRKKMLDRNLAIQEDQIAKFEASYLEDTPNGNIIRGFENYIKGTAARRRNVIGDADRVFSMSSATATSLRAAQQEAEALAQQLQSASMPTPTAAFGDPKFPLVKKKSIKRRKGEDGSESPSETETPGPKRVRISFSRQPL